MKETGRTRHVPKRCLRQKDRNGLPTNERNRSNAPSPQEVPATKRSKRRATSCAKRPNGRDRVIPEGCLRQKDRNGPTRDEPTRPIGRTNVIPKGRLRQKDRNGRPLNEGACDKRIEKAHHVMNQRGQPAKLMSSQRGACDKKIETDGRPHVIPKGGL